MTTDTEKHALMVSNHVCHILGQWVSGMLSQAEFKAKIVKEGLRLREALNDAGYTVGMDGVLRSPERE